MALRPLVRLSVSGTRWSAVLLSCLSGLLIWGLHPRLGIRDVDGYGYIMGARSLHQGAGYRSLTGEAFNQWPPGYSLLLSGFGDPVPAALMLNYLSFGVAIGLLYYLLRIRAWTWQAALGLSVTLASGFFRLLANMAHPDILTYALFLASVCLIISRPGRTLPVMIWAALVPVKYLAVVFLPPAMVADRIASRLEWSPLLRLYRPAMIAAAVAMGGILLFNVLVIDAVIPASFASAGLHKLGASMERFAISIPRTFLFNWQGSVLDPFPRIAFPVSMLLAGISLGSLRPAADRAGRWLIVYGAACLLCFGLLLFIRSYGLTANYLGYALIALVLGFRPKAWANGVWLLYGLVSLVTGVHNGMTVSSLGLNDPRYAALGAEVRSYYSESDIVASNSFHLLDLHANIPSVPVADYAEAASYQRFFWVTLPQFDSTTSVTEMPHPGREWCEEKRFSGGVLFTRCGD